MPLVTMKVKKEALEVYQRYIDTVFNGMPKLIHENVVLLGLGETPLEGTQVELMKFDKVLNGPDVWIKVEFAKDEVAIANRWIGEKTDRIPVFVPSILDEIRDEFFRLLEAMTIDVGPTPSIAIDLSWSPGRGMIKETGMTSPSIVW